MAKINKKNAAMKLGVIAIIMVVVVLLFRAGFAHVLVAFTESVDHYVFIYDDGTPEKVVRGEYVVFNLYTETMREAGYSPAKLTKTVGCTSGEYLSLKNEQLYCNGDLIGYAKAKAETKNGKPLEQFDYEGIVPEGKFFAYGTHKDSYDSRYYGFIETDKIIGTARPIF